MTTSRAESQHSHYSRRRSNTGQSHLRPLPPSLKIGDHRYLNIWVHERDSPNVIFNHSCWPGVAEGDLISVSGTTEGTSPFLFKVTKDEGCTKPQLQLSIPQPIADACGLRNNSDVMLTKVDKKECTADYVEFVFQDQYLGRNEMWRLGEHLDGQCIYTNQEITFIGSIVAKIQAIYTNGKKISSTLVTSRTKAIYRSLSAKVTIFIQVCHELWEFAGDGERYNEKIVHSFLPALFSRWQKSGTNHTVSIVLISRVFYEESEIGYAAGPLRRDDLGRWYKDFYKVITDLEVIYDWNPTLFSLKNTFWDFQRDILLTHHYHRATKDSGVGPADQVRLVGRISYAHDGPLLEALNLALNPTEHHYIDRSLSLTGVAFIVITPGTGFYRVPKQLLRLTTLRMLDQGFGLDLVSLSKTPLHQAPVFCFQGPDVGGVGDPLWGPDEDARQSGRMKTYWWEPFWISMSYWDRQVDLPFREDRFVARAKVHQIQMLGLLEHDVLASIEVPFLQAPHVQRESSDQKKLTKSEAEAFDHDVFVLKSDVKPPVVANRQSLQSPLVNPLLNTPHRPEKRNNMAHRASLLTGSRITPIEESPRRSNVELPVPNQLPHTHSQPPNTPTTSSTTSTTTVAAQPRNTSPSRDSIHSVSSNLSGKSTSIGRQTSGRTSLVSKLAPSWLLNSFRSNPSEPQTSQVSAEASPTGSTKLSLPAVPVTAVTTATVTATGAHAQAAQPSASGAPLPVVTPAPAKPIVTTQTQSPMPMAIKNTPGSRSHLSRTFEEETYVPHRGVGHRAGRSPMNNTPPFDDLHFNSATKRWSSSTTIPSSANHPHPSSSPLASTSAHLVDPCRPKLIVPLAQSSLAKRWQHMFHNIAYKDDVKWKSMVTPGCLPLTVEYFPTMTELEMSYDVFSYDFVVDPGEMRSFLVKRPPEGTGAKGKTGEEVRRAWALVVMRGMAAVRLAQGFQFVLRPPNAGGVGGGGTGAGGAGGKSTGNPSSTNAGNNSSSSTLSSTAPSSSTNDDNLSKPGFRRTKSSLNPDDDLTPKQNGAAEILKSTSNLSDPTEILKSTNEPVYLSMSNEIHRISYTGEAIQVRRYVRRMPATGEWKYECLIWPKLGGGYTEVVTSFTSHGMEDYGWNRLDMLVAGYERQFNESLRYWRTRFVVIPTTEAPKSNIGPNGEKLNDEEVRILGVEKLAEQFSKLRWQPPDERALYGPAPPVRILPTTLGPAASIMDEGMLEALERLHESGPLRKKKSGREIAGMSLMQVAKAMREEGDGGAHGSNASGAANGGTDKKGAGAASAGSAGGAGVGGGLPIKLNQWHRMKYPNSFTGSDFVSWLVREFSDVSSRAQGAEWGTKFLDQGLIEHCRGQHGFLDGHYFYHLKGEYAVPETPKSWFRRYAPEEHLRSSGYYPSSIARQKNPMPRKMKKRCILSQSMVIDIDPQKKSDQAESVVLHHDIIHNPSTVFHFELQWIGTTARCIEDMLRQWNRLIERYGIRIVEAYVSQISDIRTRNAFQSCFPLRLAVPPPIIPDLDKRVPEGTQTAKYFEYAILRKYGFIVDVEASEMYPDPDVIEVVYSYRRAPFRYSQAVHKTGVAFVQVLGGAEGFLFLTNRLMGPGRLGSGGPAGGSMGGAGMSMSSSMGGGNGLGGGGGGGSRKEHPAAAEADRIREALLAFCSDKKRLEEFYDEERAALVQPEQQQQPLSLPLGQQNHLQHVPEEPPLLAI